MEKEKEKDHRAAIAALSTSLQTLTEQVEAVFTQLDANQAAISYDVQHIRETEQTNLWNEVAAS